MTCKMDFRKTSNHAAFRDGVEGSRTMRKKARKSAILGHLRHNLTLFYTENVIIKNAHFMRVVAWVSQQIQDEMQDEIKIFQKKFNIGIDLYVL